MNINSQHRRAIYWGFWFLVVFLIVLTPSKANAQDDCLACHKDEALSLESSTHKSLSCTACHSNITAYPHPKNALPSKKESVSTCTSCHKGIVAESYAESYHGKAVNLGSQTAAACTDCHGTHTVLGQSYPASTVAAGNVSQTCSNCHDQTASGFAEGKEHFKLASTGDGAPMFFTAKFFVWLTIITVTALIIHIELQLFQNLRTILAERKRR